MQLTAEQSAAVSADGDRVGVNAGAGTGKTTVLVNRIRYLLERGVAPNQIWAFTFTRASGQELVSRIGEVEGLRVGTFHSLALDTIALDDAETVAVVNEAQSLSLMRDAMRMMGCLNGRISPATLLKRTNYARAKQAGIPVMRISDDALVDAYTGLLAMGGMEDYLGLLLRLYALQGNRRFDGHHVLVDEAQDLDPIQWGIYDAMLRGGANGYLVFDPRQTIYEWRDANYEDAITRVTDRYDLTHSMRIPRDIASLANAMAAAAGLPEAPLVSVKDFSGAELTKTPPSVAVGQLINEELFSPGDIMVLARTNAEVDAITQELIADGIPCEQPRSDLAVMRPLLAFITRPNAFTRKQLAESCVYAGDQDWTQPHCPTWVASVLSTTDDATLAFKVARWRDSLCVKPTVRAVLDAVYGKTQEIAVVAWKNTYGDWDISEALNDQAVATVAASRGRDSVTVCTIHQSKGLEAPAVVLSLSHTKNTSAEAYRLMYVALTRTQERCVISDQCKGPDQIAGLISRTLANP